MSENELIKFSRNYGVQLDLAATRKVMLERIQKNLELKEEIYEKIKSRKTIKSSP